MNSLQIQYFMETAKLLNFSKAGEALCVSQPAVSRQIARLEKELGVTLFKRSTHGIELTVTGKHIYDFFRNSKVQLDQILSISLYSAVKEIFIDVYEGGAEVAYNILRLANVFMDEKYPCVEVYINARVHSELDDLLNSDSNHLVIAPQMLFEDHDHIQILPLEKGQITLTYSPDLFKDLDRQVCLIDFNSKPFLCLDGSSASKMYRKTILGRLRSYGLDSKIRGLPTMDSIINNIIYGKGYSITGIVDNRFSKSTDIQYYSLDSYTYLCAAYHKESNDIIKELATHLKQLMDPATQNRRE